jgi:glycogen synthase
MVIGEDPAADAARFYRTESGITLVTRDMLRAAEAGAEPERGGPGGGMKVLHVAAEVFPLVKTGGLADVVARCRWRWPSRAPTCACCCPGCRRCWRRCSTRAPVIDIGSCFGALRVRCCWRACRHALPVYVIDAPYLYRAGRPLPGPAGRGVARQPAALRAAGLGGGAPGRRRRRPGWAPDVVHAHDWHAAMACAYMAEHPATRRRRCSPCTTWPSRACSRCTTGRCWAWPRG